MSQNVSTELYCAHENKMMAETEWNAHPAHKNKLSFTEMRSRILGDKTKNRSVLEE